MQTITLHKKVYQIQRIDETDYSPEVYERKNKLELYKQLVSEGCSQNTALKAIGTSRASYYRWRKRYQLFGLIGLENESRRPNNLRKPQWNQEIEHSVVNIRRQFPLWGKYKIAVILKREFGLKVSASTVGRILCLLLRRGLICPVSFHFGKVRNKRSRVFNGHAQRWRYGMKAKAPGELIQIDHACIELEPGTEIKHFKAICPITKITVEQAYKHATSTIASKFLSYVQQNFPFTVRSIQVDGGSEFMGEFEHLCKEKNIALYVLPPKSPKYNAHVERSNGTVKYEFYYQYEGSMNLDNIRRDLQKYVSFYNTFRPHQALHFLTPWQYYKQLEAR